MTWQEDPARMTISPNELRGRIRHALTVYDPHRDTIERALADLDSLVARLEKADRLARAVRAYCGTSHADCAPKDPDDEFDLGCSLQPLSAALVEWDGDAA